MRIIALCSLLILIASCSKPPSLNIGLRCDENAKGRLEVYFDDEKDILPVKAHDLDINGVCEQEDISISSPEYKYGTTIRFIKVLEDGTKHELISTYGEDINGDRSGNWMILRIMNQDPYIANDVL